MGDALNRAHFLRLCQNVLVLAVTVLVTFLFIEVFFRFFHLYSPSADSNTKYVNVFQSLKISPHPFYPGYHGAQISYYSYKYKPNSIWATQYPDNERGYFDGNNQIVYKMNFDGFRDYQFGEKKNDIYRIVVIGDSYVLGEGVKLEDTFPKVLESMLRKKYRGIEVYNLGVNGFDIRDETVVLDENLKKYKPDMVIWGYVLNDISHPDFDNFPNEIKRIKRKFYFRTSLCFVNYFQDRVWNFIYSQKYTKFVLDQYNDEAKWNELTILLKKAFENIKYNKSSVFVLVFPDLNAISRKQYVFSPIHDKLQKFFLSNRIHFIDFSDAFKSYGPLELRVHPIDAHPNEIGHHIVAEKISQDATIIATIKDAN